jgi:hypothetical protein
MRTVYLSKNLAGGEDSLIFKLNAQLEFLNERSFDYLTLSSSREVIKERRIEYEKKEKRYLALDPYMYAVAIPSAKNKMSIGRMKGFSSSDVSAMIARTLFYDEIIKNNRFCFMGSYNEHMIPPGDEYVEEYSKLDLLEDIAGILKSSGEEVRLKTSEKNIHLFNPGLWKECHARFYVGHGNRAWAGINYYDIPLMQGSLMINSACLTCSSEEHDSFCNHAFRKGGYSVSRKCFYFKI